MNRLITLTAVAAALVALDAGAQVAADPRIPPVSSVVQLDGPRFGVSVLSSGIVDSLAAHDIDVSALITQFGWQFERQIYALGGGPIVLMELVPLLGGLDQGVAIPSVSGLVGLRAPSGAEFGVGPNYSPAGPALVFAGGFTRRAGAILIPINASIVQSRVGTRMSLLTGFTLRTGRSGVYRSIRPPGRDRRLPSVEPNVPYPCLLNAQLCYPPLRVPVKANPPYVPARVEGVGVCWVQSQPCRRPPP